MYLLFIILWNHNFDDYGEETLENFGPTFHSNMKDALYAYSIFLLMEILSLLPINLINIRMYRTLSAQIANLRTYLFL